FSERGRAEWFDADSERSHRTCDKGAIARCLPCQPNSGAVDRLQFFRYSERGQSSAVGAERVGLEDLSAGFDVILVNLLYNRSRGEVQLVITAIDEDALGVEHGAHRSVCHEHAFGQKVPK